MVFFHAGYSTGPAKLLETFRYAVHLIPIPNTITVMSSQFSYNPINSAKIPCLLPQESSRQASSFREISAKDSKPVQTRLRLPLIQALPIPILETSGIQKRVLVWSKEGLCFFYQKTTYGKLYFHRAIIGNYFDNPETARTTNI